MQCRHRFTGRPICATPCDGRDDLCAGDEDELGCTLAAPALAIAAAIAVLLAAAVAAVEIHRKRRPDGGGGGADGNDIPLASLAPHEEEDAGNSSATELLSEFIVANHLGGLEAGQKVAKALYETRLEAAGGDIAKADAHFFDALGTSSDTMDFYDAIDEGAFFRIKVK